MPAGVIFTAQLGSGFVYVAKSEHFIKYHIDKRKGSVFWNVFCSLMGVKYCSVTGINDFAGVFSAGPGSSVVSLCSSIWYYLALIELSSIPSLSPPSALLLSSFPLLPARDGSSERRREQSPLLFFHPGANSNYPSVNGLQYFPFRVFSHLSPPFSVFTLHPPPTRLLFSLCLLFSSSVHHQFQFMSLVLMGLWENVRCYRSGRLHVLTSVYCTRGGGEN